MAHILALTVFFLLVFMRTLYLLNVGFCASPTDVGIIKMIVRTESKIDDSVVVIFTPNIRVSFDIFSGQFNRTLSCLNDACVA